MNMRHSNFPESGIMRDRTIDAIGTRAIAVTALLAIVSMTTWAATKGPDAGGYTGTDATVYSFIDIGSGNGGTSVLTGTDDGLAALTLPFAFQFYGSAYSIACVSTNGALYFVANPGACGGFNDFSNTDLTNTVPPNDLPAVFPLWSDLTFDVPGAGAVFYKAVGSAGSRKFIVQWSNAYPQGVSAPVTFQAVLVEGSNTILFQYQGVDVGAGAPATNGGAATIGIRNTGAVTTQQQTQWSFGVSVLANSTALLFAPGAASLTARMVGLGKTDAGGVRYEFDFTVENGSGKVKPGKLSLQTGQITGGKSKGKFVSTSIDQAAFTDDPAISPADSNQKVDTVTFSGSGRWNDMPGYTFAAEASDAGQPGAGHDRFAITVRSSLGVVVATVSGPITSGNIEVSGTKK
jgi:hypothetical protein